MTHSQPSGVEQLSSFPVGSRVTYTCLYGAIRIPGLLDTVQCLPGSRWSELRDPCGRKYPTFPGRAASSLKLLQQLLCTVHPLLLQMGTVLLMMGEWSCSCDAAVPAEPHLAAPGSTVHPASSFVHAVRAS